MGRAPIKTRASEAQETASRAESERLALSRLADAVRDCRALGLAIHWTVVETEAVGFQLRVTMRDPAAGRALLNMCHGADS